VQKTISYFDIFDYPLTSLEIWKYLYLPDAGQTQSGAGPRPGSRAGLEEIISILNNPELNQGIEFAQGFYFLRGRGAIVDVRKRRYLIAEPKLKKAKKYCRYLASLEGVLGIAVANTLALQNSRLESDIDLFVISRAGQIWSTRFWSVLPLYFIGGRPRGADTRDKFCLSYFVDEDHLDIRPWKLEDDIYYVYWLATLLPLFGENIFEKFWQENQWVKKYLPNFLPPKSSPRLNVAPVANLPITRAENFLRFLQMRGMPRSLKDLAAGEGSEVVIRDGVLKFHPNDRRREYQNEFNQRINNLH